MIRFCNSETYCIEWRKSTNEYSINREALLKYFSKGHQENVVCVQDDATGRFIGILTYRSLKRFSTVHDALRTECLHLDGNIWKNSREYCKRHPRSGREYLIPVLDGNDQLLCFAYEDLEANREIRMLRELSEASNALQFADLYPDCKCVRIHGFNELAYFFAKYLENQRIMVEVSDGMWGEVFCSEPCNKTGGKYMEIYAEGVWEKTDNWRENLLRSVSVEFECIDKIYEKNIRTGRFNNTHGRGIKELLEYLKEDGKEIMICGTGRDEQNAYDYLIGNGIEISSFINGQKGENGHRLFGKEIVNESNIREHKNPVIINCRNRNSIWGMGEVDYYDYVGYRRNKEYILLKDYVDIPENDLMNLLRKKKIVLTGEMNLCSWLLGFLQQHNVSVRGYLHIADYDDDRLCGLQEIGKEDIVEENICLIVVPTFHRYGSIGWKGEERKEETKQYLTANGIHNYTDYFSDMISFIHMERNTNNKYPKEWLRPRKVVLGSIEAYSGNDFFRALLDSHPEMMIIYYSNLNNNLFWICSQLAMEEVPDIIPILWKLIGGNEKTIFDASKFNEGLQQLLDCDSCFTPQELFVMIHVAYMYMCGRDIPKNEIRDMVIYWEPHYVDRTVMEECVYWLGTDDIRCDIVNVVRNACIRNGSCVKAVLREARNVHGMLYEALSFPNIDKQNYTESSRLIVKFEDIKCKPRETLAGICDSLGIGWSDTLMQTTRWGKEFVYSDGYHTISGFDLKPVYNLNEDIFSEFDRFRITLIATPWQRKYGYPYVESLCFTRKELQEIFLKRFRFEDMDDTKFGEDIMDYRIWRQLWINERLQEVRMTEMTLIEELYDETRNESRNA